MREPRAVPASPGPLTARARAAGPGGRAAHAHSTVPGGLCGAGAAAARGAHRRAAPRRPPRAPPARRGPRPPARRQFPRAAAGAPVPARGLPGAGGRAAGARPARRAWGVGAGVSESRASAQPVWVLRAPGWGMARRAADLSVLQSVKLCISSQLGHTADCTCYCWLRQPKTAAARACAGGEAMGGGGGRLPAAAAPASLRLVMTWLCCRVRAGLSAAHDFAMGRCCAAVCASECFHMSAVTVWWLVQGLWVHAIP